MRKILLFIQIVATTLISLDSSNWSLINQGFWLVEFFSPTCGHCTKFAPDFLKLSKILATEQVKKQIEISVANVDCEANRSFCNEHGITGVPNVKLFEDGELLAEFQGGNTFEAVSQFVVDQMDQASISLELDSDYESDETEDKHPLLSMQTNELYTENGKVLQLTPENEHLIRSGVWMIKIYSEYCGYCKQIAPIWDDLATLAMGKLNVAAINGEEFPELRKQFDVTQYPTIVVVNSGVKSVYQGLRTLDAFVDFADSISKKSIEKISIHDTSVSKLRETRFLYAYNQEEESEVFDKTVIQISKMLFLVTPFYMTCDKELIQKLGITRVPSLSIIKRDQIWTNSDVDNLEDWAKIVKYPFFAQMNEITASDMIHSGKKIILAIYDITDPIQAGKMALFFPFYCSSIAQGLPYSIDIQCAFIDKIKFSDFISSTFGAVDSFKIVVYQPLLDLYYEQDPNGNPIQPNQESIETTLNAISHGKLKGYSTKGSFLVGISLLTNVIYSKLFWLLLLAGGGFFLYRRHKKDQYTALFKGD